MYRSQCTDRNVPIAMYRSQCTDRNVPIAMCRSQCADRNVPIAMCRSQCGNRNVPIAMCRSQCADHNVPIAMCRPQWYYCTPGNFSDVETLANLAINSFSLKLQVANLVLHCSPSTSIKVCTMESAKLAKIKRRNRLIFGKR